MIRPFGAHRPRVHPTAFVHPTAEVIGKVRLGARSSIWPGAVLRGDIEEIVVGEATNIQDNAVVHTDHGVPVVLGSGITVGHGAILHSCRVEDDSLVGMGAILLGRSTVEKGALVGAGALVPPGAVVPAGKLALGSPARAVRDLTDSESREVLANAQRYVELAQSHARSLASAKKPAVD